MEEGGRQRKYRVDRAGKDGSGKTEQHQHRKKVGRVGDAYRNQALQAVILGDAGLLDDWQPSVDI